MRVLDFPPWRLAASIILTSHSSFAERLCSSLGGSRYLNKAFNHDYHILMLKRPNGSRSFGGRNVFPGGVVSPEDFSHNWREVVTPPQDVRKSKFQPQIYSDAEKYYMANESDSLPASQALRICAVRELFEETGILLACDKSDESKPPHLLACLLSHSDCKAWRKRVQEKAGSLALLYGELGLKLPLSALEEWSNWLTPAHNKKRFDTIFYYAGISGLKYLNGGSSSVISEPSEEVHSLYLDSPAAFLSHNPNDEGPVFMSTTKSPLMPPQAYELCRVIRFPHVAQLTRFARQRASFGCRRWNCVLAYAKCNKTNDSLVPMYLLPGDKRYKDAHEFSEEHGETITLTGDWQSDSHLNRLLIMRKQYPGLWWKSNIFDLGHVLPVTLEEFTMNYAQN